MEEKKLNRIIELLESNNNILESIEEHIKEIYKNMPLEKNTEVLEENIFEIKKTVQNISETLNQNM